MNARLDAPQRPTGSPAEEWTPRRRARVRGLAYIVAAPLLAFASACAHPQAKAVVEPPPLDVPPPPPRLVEPMTAELPPPIGPVNAPAPAPVPRPARPPSPPAPRPDTSRTEAPRADAAPADAPKPTDDAAIKAAAPAPATLQTTTSQQEAEVETRIRGVLSKAQSDLNRVDYARLNNNAKSQYDQAKRFVSMSEESIRSRNLVYAGTLADKAAELAAQLAGR